MNRVLLAYFPLLFVTLVTAAPVPKEVKKRSDAERILGKWVCESATNGPTVYTTSHLNDVWTFAPAGEKSEQRTPTNRTYTLDYSFPERGIDLPPIELALSGNKYKGVYDLDGDTLRVAFKDGVRPTGLDSTPGVFVFTFRRQTDVPKK